MIYYAISNHFRKFQFFQPTDWNNPSTWIFATIFIYSTMTSFINLINYFPQTRKCPPSSFHLKKPRKYPRKNIYTRWNGLGGKRSKLILETIAGDVGWRAIDTVGDYLLVRALLSLKKRLTSLRKHPTITILSLIRLLMRALPGR